MKCKDIPDRPLLEFLAEKRVTLAPFMTVRWQELHEAVSPETPPKLVLAKLRMMLRRGVVNGCGCGCRGDFVITDKGLKELEESI